MSLLQQFVVKGNVYCPFCGEEMAGYKVQDGGPDFHWWHRCWNNDPGVHTLVLVDAEGKLPDREVDLGERIYVRDDYCFVEGQYEGRSRTFQIDSPVLQDPDPSVEEILEWAAEAEYEAAQRGVQEHEVPYLDMDGTVYHEC